MTDTNHEPPMGELLASIKRVMAEEEAGAPGADLSQSSEEDVLDLVDPMPDEDRLISKGSADASRKSLATLAALRQQRKAPASSTISDGPLEAMVRDMVRPMLKDWLDQRLPDIIDEMVAREIARITGKNL